ncbi:NDP-sugar synthase [uncultured Shewanella sp.]|uniref:NDP-sugar synthase n=1 Tax=uncultured Shewanella sp. TaxID=173975 RepID=UPI002606E3FE|nr:NDP-sugar synthase [uncultured Shewanella sp.]
MKAIIFANRHGNEIAPLNEYYCPALLPIGNKAVIDYTLEDLFHSDINDIKLVVSDHVDAIRDHVKNGEKWGLNIDYFLSQSQESSESILKKMSIDINESLLLIRGDMLRSPCIKKFIHFSKNIPQAFIQAKMNNQKAGLILLPAAQHFTNDINWPLNHQNEAIEESIYQSTQPSVTQVLHGHCYMLNSFHSIMQANLNIANLTVPDITPMGRKFVSRNQNNKGFYIGTKTDPNLVHTQNANGIIGASTQMAPSVELKKTVVIGSNCLIEPKCEIENSVIFPNTYVGPRLKANEAMICQDLLISPKNNSCIRITDPVLITRNTPKEKVKKVSYLSRIIALIALLVSGLLLPVFFLLTLLSNSKKTLIKQTLIDNKGKKLNSYRWALSSPLLSRTPQLIYVITGQLDLFGHAPKSSLEAYKKDTVYETKYGILGPVQLFIDPNAPDEEKSLIEKCFENTQGKAKYLSLVWGAMVNTHSII